MAIAVAMMRQAMALAQLLLCVSRMGLFTLDSDRCCCYRWSMILELNDPLWTRLYNGIRDEYYDSADHTQNVDKQQMEQRLRELGIAVHRDADGRWTAVQLPLGCQRTILMLKYS